MTKMILIPLLIIASLSLASCTTSNPEPTQIPTSPTIPANWTTSTLPSLNLSLSYPKELQQESIGSNSILLLNPNVQSPTGNTNFIYLSYIPDLTTPQPGDIYNFSQEQFQLILSEDETVDLSQGNQSEWFTYTRQPDLSIASQPSLYYLNTNPWEFPSGTTEIRLILSTPRGYYLLGGYGSDTGLSLDTIRQVLQSITFSTPTPSIDTTEVSLPDN